MNILIAEVRMGYQADSESVLGPVRKNEVLSFLSLDWSFQC